jgi:hypothetical protein
VAAKIHARIGNKHVHTHADSRFGAPSSAAMWGIEFIFNYFQLDNQQLRWEWWFFFEIRLARMKNRSTFAPAFENNNVLWQASKAV